MYLLLILVLLAVSLSYFIFVDVMVVDIIVVVIVVDIIVVFIVVSAASSDIASGTAIHYWLSPCHMLVLLMYLLLILLLLLLLFQVPAQVSAPERHSSWPLLAISLPYMAEIRRILRRWPSNAKRRDFQLKRCVTESIQLGPCLMF